MKNSRLALMLAVVLGSVSFLLLFSLLASEPLSTVAAPLPQTAETEPNNDFDTADPFPVPGYATGQLTTGSPTPDTMDYFSITTQVGSQYEASLTALSNPTGLLLRFRVYNSNRELLKTSSSSASSSSVSWTAYSTGHYIRVEALATTTTLQIASYRLDVDMIAPTPTPPPTNTPTNTPTPETGEDDYEQNDDFNTAYFLPVETSISLKNLLGKANIFPVNDPDWFAFYTKNGYYYEAETDELSGIDTYLEIRDKNNNVVTGNDDGAGGYASRASWRSTYNGYYFIRITNKVNTTGSYNLTVREVGPPSTSTPGPTPTAGPGPHPNADDCEDNLDFDHACIIPPDSTLTFNFFPPYGGVDNDFFKLWVKPGFIYECATSNLAPGVDPNMIVFSGPSWERAVGGNDDRDPANGDINSAFTYYATYEGWFYILVGTGNRTPSDLANSAYNLRCNRNVPGIPTAVPTSTPRPTSEPQPTNTPIPRPENTPIPTPAPGGVLSVRLMATPPPRTSPPTPALHFVPVDMLVYYDANGDGSPGAGEGVGGIQVLAYDTATGAKIAEGFTDELGSLQFTAAAQGALRLNIPYLGISRLASDDGGTIYVRIAPRPLPGSIP